MFLIDSFSIWVLGHLWDPLPTRLLFWKKAGNISSYTLGLHLPTSLIYFFLISIVSNSFWIYFFSIWMFGNCLNWFRFYLFFRSALSWFIFSLGFWNFLNGVLFYLAAGPSLGHHVPTRWKTIYISTCVFKMFVIDFLFLFVCLEFVSNDFFFKVLNWFLDFFSICLLGHARRTLCQPNPSFEKTAYLSIWVFSNISRLISFLFRCLQMFLIDFVSIWILPFLTWFLLSLDFLKLS